MTKNLILLIAAIFVFSCKNDPSADQQVTSQPPVEGLEPAIKETPVKSYEENMEYLKANAIDINDTYGRVKKSMGNVQALYQKSYQLKPAEGQHTLTVDENFNLVIKQEKDGMLIEKRVNLKHIDHKDGGIRLLPDKSLDELPGFEIDVLAGKQGVVISQNGKKMEEKKALEIYMADRTMIEQAIPSFMAALNVVHGRN